MDYDLAVFIGRFQILHTRHLAIILEGLKKANFIAVLVGSANAARSHRNPFTFGERSRTILESVEAAGYDPKRVLCLPLEDSMYSDDKWMTDVRTSIKNFEASNVALIGYNKDHTSYYLNMFPEWGSINVEKHIPLASTHMRESYFSNIGEQWTKHCDGDREGDSEKDHLVPTPVKKFLQEFMETPEYKNIRAEYEFVIEYRRPYMSMPFPPTFVTADAVVTQSGHILLVKRKNHPGKGLLALPGGFVKNYQTVRQAMIDELCEETLIDQLNADVTKDYLDRSIIASHVFDDPYRDPRGRVITHAFHTQLERKRKLFEVKGDDDAELAHWVKLSEVKRDMMFSDHYDIIWKLVLAGNQE